MTQIGKWGRFDRRTRTIHRTFRSNSRALGRRRAWALLAAGVFDAAGFSVFGQEAPLAVSSPECFDAVVLPRRSVNVTAPREGTVEALHVVLGDVVRAGAPLVTLASRDLRFELESAEVAWAESGSEEQKAIVALARAQNQGERVLARPEAYSEVERMEVELVRQSAEHDLSIARARVERRALDIAHLKDLLRRCEIVAPYDGTVCRTFIDAGSTVTQAAPLVRLISSNDLLVRFALPPQRAAAVRRGDRVRFVVATDHQELWATVEGISPELDAGLLMIVVEAGTSPSPEANSRVQSGLWGCVELLGSSD